VKEGPRLKHGDQFACSSDADQPGMRLLHTLDRRLVRGVDVLRLEGDAIEGGSAARKSGSPLDAFHEDALALKFLGE
jgi:hypothetical protein